MPRAAWLVILLVSLTGGCPLPEMGGQGQKCFESSDPCNGGLACVGGICVVPDCTNSTDCPQGQYCDVYSYQCRPGCDHSDRCQPDYYCDVVEHQCKRDPNLPARKGEPCNFIAEFGTVNADAGQCEENLICMGYGTLGGVGYCPGNAPEECWMVEEVYHPDCVAGVCGGSFCCALCSAGSCPDGYKPLQLQSDECVCLPLSASEGCHPLEQDCPGGAKCVPNHGLATRCIPLGSVPPGGACRWADNDLCQAGFICVGSADQNFCRQLCDQENPVDCPAGTNCAPIADVERWGFCKDEA